MKNRLCAAIQPDHFRMTAQIMRECIQDLRAETGPFRRTAADTNAIIVHFQPCRIAITTHHPHLAPKGAGIGMAADIGDEFRERHAERERAVDPELPQAGAEGAIGRLRIRRTAVLAKLPFCISQRTLD